MGPKQYVFRPNQKSKRYVLCKNNTAYHPMKNIPSGKAWWWKHHAKGAEGGIPDWLKNSWSDSCYSSQGDERRQLQFSFDSLL